MNKEELIEAINATIVPNNVKGITAESLANLLTEMVNASGSGEAGVVFYAGSVNMDTLEFTQTEEQKAHNAEMFQVVANSSMGVPVSINMNGVYESEIGISEGITYIITLSNVMYVSEDIAAEFGAPSAMIEAYNDEFWATIQQDGTLVLEYNEA